MADDQKGDPQRIPILESNMKPGSTGFFPIVIMIAMGLLVPLSSLSFGQGTKSEPKLFPPNSPEHQALTASSPYLADEEFYLRNDYWKGAVTTKTGTAMRLQFFKGNEYQLFFGAAKDQLPPGTRLHLHIFDAKNKEVVSTTSEPGAAAVTLGHKNKKTGQYLILMRIEIPDEEASSDQDDEKIPSVLFYGWK